MMRKLLLSLKRKGRPPDHAVAVPERQRHNGQGALNRCTMTVRSPGRASSHLTASSTRSPVQQRKQKAALEQTRGTADA